MVLSGSEGHVPVSNLLRIELRAAKFQDEVLPSSYCRYGSVIQEGPAFVHVYFGVLWGLAGMVPSR